MGGNKIQGRADGDRAGSKERLIEDALAVQESGASAIVIEGVPTELAKRITEQLSIPTIGIGAGPHCDGQVLVMHDLLGLSPRTFTFAKPYVQLREQAKQAVAQYVSEVQSGVWPDADHSFS
jgi:3-methyl-2-oxobutanoate hydroxymethyltransferase